jgi:hypothetical protein
MSPINNSEFLLAAFGNAPEDAVPWASHQAGLWWRLHTPRGETAPRTAVEAFSRLRQLKIRIPIVVRVAFGGKFPRILHRRFPEFAGGGA